MKNKNFIKKIEAEIKLFILQLTNVDISEEILNINNLVSGQVIDSLGIIELVTHIESKYNIKMEQEDLTVENLDSVQSISIFILSKIQ